MLLVYVYSLLCVYVCVPVWSPKRFALRRFDLHTHPALWKNCFSRKFSLCGEQHKVSTMETPWTKHVPKLTKIHQITNLRGRTYSLQQKNWGYSCWLICCSEIATILCLDISLKEVQIIHRGHTLSRFISGLESSGVYFCSCCEQPGAATVHNEVHRTG